MAENNLLQTLTFSSSSQASATVNDYKMLIFTQVMQCDASWFPVYNIMTILFCLIKFTKKKKTEIK